VERDQYCFNGSCLRRLIDKFKCSTKIEARMAKKHFNSDILVGATLGYVTGTRLANHD